MAIIRLCDICHEPISGYTRGHVILDLISVDGLSQNEFVEIKDAFGNIVNDEVFTGYSDLDLCPACLTKVVNYISSERDTK